MAIGCLRLFKMAVAVGSSKFQQQIFCDMIEIGEVIWAKTLIAPILFMWKVT